MNNITKITEAGTCVGCGSCDICEHISFVNNKLGFPSPVVDENCTHCGDCLKNCIFDPDNDD